MLKKPLKPGDELYVRCAAVDAVSHRSQSEQIWLVKPVHSSAFFEVGEMLVQARHMFDVDHVLVARFAPGDLVHNTRGTCEALKLVTREITCELADGSWAPEFALVPVDSQPTLEESILKLRELQKSDQQAGLPDHIGRVLDALESRLAEEK